MSSFFAELQRRNVYKVSVAYAIIAWLLIQIVDVLFPAYNAPDWVLQIFIIIIALGFPVAVFLAWAYELTPEGIRPTESVQSPEKLSIRTAKKLNALIISLLCLVIVVLVIDNYVLVDEPDTDSATQVDNTPPVAIEPGPEAQPITVTDKSVAVLPFVSMSTDQEQQYFADGLSEEILNRLAQVPGLKVAARTSSFYFKDKDYGISAIGEMLDVAYVLEGSIRRFEDTIRATAQLNRAADGFHLWSKTFDRPLEDVFAMQDEIATEVSEAMQVSLGVAKLSRMPGMTTNFLAYDAYLKATRVFEFTGQDIARVIEHLEEAVELDPEFALAWSTLSEAYAISNMVLPGGFTDWQSKVIEALFKVSQLAPDAPYAITQRVGYSLAQGDWLQAEQVIKEVITSAEKYGVADDYVGLNVTFLRFTGRNRQALTVQQQNRIRDPLNEEISAELVELYHAVGDLDAALAEADYAIENDWASLRLSGDAFVAALAGGDRAEIEKRYAKLPVQAKEVLTSGVINTTMMALLDDREEAIAELNRLIESPDHRAALDQSIIAIWAAYFDDTQLVMRGFRRIGLNFSVLLNNAWLPIFSDTRKTPEFKELMSQLGLVNYWRITGNWADDCKPLPGGLSFECS